jgi:hypothetical protein
MVVESKISKLPKNIRKRLKEEAQIWDAAIAAEKPVIVVRSIP